MIAAVPTSETKHSCGKQQRKSSPLFICKELCDTTQTVLSGLETAPSGFMEELDKHPCGGVHLFPDFM